MRKLICPAVILIFLWTLCSAGDIGKKLSVGEILRRKLQIKCSSRENKKDTHVQSVFNINTSLNTIGTNTASFSSAHVTQKASRVPLNVRAIRDLSSNSGTKDETDLKYSIHKLTTAIDISGGDKNSATEKHTQLVNIPLDINGGDKNSAIEKHTQLVNIPLDISEHREESVQSVNKTSSAQTNYTTKNNVNIMPINFQQLLHYTRASRSSEWTANVITNSRTRTENTVFPDMFSGSSDLEKLSDIVEEDQIPRTFDKEYSMNINEIVYTSKKYYGTTFSDLVSLAPFLKSDNYLSTSGLYSTKSSFSSISGSPLEAKHVISLSVGNTHKADNPLITRLSLEPAFAADQSNNITKTLGPDYEHSEEEDMYPRIRSVVSEPDWRLAKMTWSYAWEIHVHVLGSVFGIVGIYNVISVVRLWRSKRLLPIGYFLSLHTIIMFLCLTRAVYLLHDGYNSRRTYHVSLNQFLYSFPFICLTSTFSLLAYSHLKAIQVQVLPPFLQKLQILIPIIFGHFAVTIIGVVLVGYNTGAEIMHVVCQMFFIVWGSFIFFGYAYKFRQIYSQALKRQEQVTNNLSHGYYYTVQANVKSKLTLSAAVKVTFLTATSGLIVVGMETYAFVDLHIFTTDRPKPWPWWMFHTVLRLAEIFMCITLSYSVSLPLKYKLSEGRFSCGVLIAPCSEILCCDQASHRWSSLQQTRSIHNDNAISLTDNSTVQLLDVVRSDAHPGTSVHSSYHSRSNSLLIIEDVYVRFHTDHDINKIVDSLNDDSQPREDVHKTDTFPLRDCHVGREQPICSSTNEDKENSNEAAFHTDMSGDNSVASSELFRVPSSVSLAESMENEIFKAFENLKMDSCKY